jgi:hypothetical protein
MPYIVTTERELPSAEDSSTLTYRERRAVATLEKARLVVREAVFTGSALTAPAIWNSIAVLPESGGTVGPLPDGTVIEVEAVSWADLRERAGLGRDALVLDEQTITAYNTPDRARP